jgi:hypothetical protein
MQYSVLEQAMMTTEQLGADETKPGAPFWRLINPTEVDKVAVEMARLIKSYYPGWDFFNPNLWRKLGADVGLQGNPLQQFLQGYIQIAREYRRSFSDHDKEWWIDIMGERFDFRRDDLEDYFRAMQDMIRAGTMSETILKPYTYEPTELGEDFTKTVFPRLVIAAAVIGGVFVLSSTLIPQITSSVATSRARRRRRR